ALCFVRVPFMSCSYAVGAFSGQGSTLANCLIFGVQLRQPLVLPDLLSRFGRAVRNCPFGGARSADLENADKESAVDDLEAEQDGGTGWDDEPHRLRIRQRTKLLGTPGAERVEGQAEP